MPTIADILGINSDQPRPRWRTVNAWDLRPGDLVRVAADDLRQVWHVWANATTGEVTIQWSDERYADLTSDTTMKVKR